MRTLRFVFATLGLLASGFVACGDDDVTVRPRLDGGLDATVAPDVDAGPTLPCGAPLPASYVSVGFAQNAKVELDLIAHYDQLDAKMKETEGPGATVVTAATLKGIFNDGAPSLRAVSTNTSQTIVEGYLDAYGAAAGKTWTPVDAEAEGGVASGGKYDATFHFGPTGVDLREATAKTLLAGAFYHHVVGIVQAPVTEATIDRLVAAFGAKPSFANRTDPDAGAEGDRLAAELASKRDDKGSSRPGPYRSIAAALIRAKAAAAGGEPCKKDLDDAIAVYFSEWERATYATAIFHLNEAATKATIAPVQGPAALRAFGAALGLIQGLKGVPQVNRTITDPQIDALLLKIGAPTPYRLITASAERVLKLAEAMNDIAAIYSFSAADVESFKKSF